MNGFESISKSPVSFKNLSATKFELDLSTRKEILSKERRFSNIHRSWGKIQIPPASRLGKARNAATTIELQHPNDTLLQRTITSHPSEFFGLNKDVVRKDERKLLFALRLHKMNH